MDKVNCICLFHIFNKFKRFFAVISTMPNNSSPYDWDKFVLNLKLSDTEYIDTLKEATCFSIQRSPQTPFIHWRVAPHVFNDFRALREGIITNKVDERVVDASPEDARSESESNRVIGGKPDQESISTHRTVSSSPMSSIRLQLDAPFLNTIEYPYAVLDIIRFFLTHPYTIYGEPDSIFQKSSALSILEGASKLMRNVPGILDRHIRDGEQRSKSSPTSKDGNNVPPINILLERLFTEPKLLLELMNVGKLKSSDFLFEKITIPYFIKPPVLRMSLSVENLVVGMANKEVMEPFYGSIALYYRTSNDNNQRGLYRVSESQYVDFNCLSTLKNFTCGKAESDSKSLYNRLMTIVDTIERSKIIEFTIPISSQICFSRIFLVVFLEKTVGVSCDEAHAFYFRIRELEDEALLDEKIRSEVDRYSLYLQRLAEGVACHDIRIISGIINNKFSPNRHDAGINEAIVRTLSQTIDADNQTNQASLPNNTSQYVPQSTTKKKVEPKKYKFDPLFFKYPGIDYTYSGSFVSESKVPTNIFAAYGKYGEQILAECNKYLPKVKAAIKQTGGLRETFAVSVSPIFPLSAFSIKEDSVSKRTTSSYDHSSHTQGAAPSMNNIDAGSTRVTLDQIANTLPYSHYHEPYPTVSTLETQQHVLTRNISLMGVPAATLRQDDSTPTIPAPQGASLQRKSDTIIGDTTVSIQQLENFLSLTKIIYSKYSDIKRQDGMEKQIKLQDLWEANCLLNPDSDSFVHFQDLSADSERKELINRIYEHFIQQKKTGIYSAEAFKDSHFISGSTRKNRLVFVHPFKPVTHKLNTFVRLPKNIPQTEPFSSTLLNIYNDRASKRRALSYIQLYIKTTINSFGTYDLSTGVFKVTKDAPTYHTLQPNHLPDYTHSNELMIWSYGLSLLEKGDHDELLLLLKHRYLTTDTLSHLLLFSLMNAKQLSNQRIYLVLRDATTTLDHKKDFSSLQSHYFLDRIRGNRHHPNHIYVKQLDCFFRKEIGSPAAPFRNRVYLYPQFFNVILPSVRYQAFFLKVEMRSDDTLSNKDIMWTIYPRLHGSMTSSDIAKGRIAFRSSYLTSAVTNSRSLRLHDEIKFELPLCITPKTHFLFTLYGVPELSKKDKNRAERCDLSTIVGVDDTVFVPQEKTATRPMNTDKFASLYATSMHGDTPLNNMGQVPPGCRNAQGRMAAASSANSVQLHHTESLPSKSSQCLDTLRTGIHDPINLSNVQHIVEARTQLSLLGYAFLPLVKGIDESGIPVLQNVLGVDLMTSPVMSNSEFAENYDKSIMISFQGHISAGYLSSQIDKEKPQQGTLDTNSKQTKQVGYMYCTIRYESILYTHFHFLNSVYYAYTCTKNIVNKSCVDFDNTVKVLRNFCENVSLYATNFKMSHDKYSGNYTSSSVVEDSRAQTMPTNVSFVLTQAQIMASKRKSVPATGEIVLLEHYGPVYNIAVAMASMLMHNRISDRIISRNLIFNYLEYILTPFSTISNESMAITNNLYHHCINEEISAAFKAHKNFGKCNSWLMMLRNFSFTPFLESMLAPLFGPAYTTQYLLDSEFRTLSDIYKTLGGIGNHISFINQKTSHDMTTLGPFRQDYFILSNLAIHMMDAHYTSSITTFQDLQNYVFYLHDSIINSAKQSSSLLDRFLTIIPHNLLLIVRSFMLILFKYKHLYNAHMSCFFFDEMTLEVSGTSSSFDAVCLSNTAAPCDSVERETFEADLITFINSIVRLINVIFSGISAFHHMPDSLNKTSAIITSVAKFFIIMINTSPKKSKLFALIKALIDPLVDDSDSYKTTTQLTKWKIVFEFLNQLAKERSLLYSYSFTDIHAKKSVILEDNLTDTSDNCSNYTLPPFNLIPQACLIPYMYIKALHYLMSIPVSRLNSDEDYVSFRSICVDIFTVLWEICSEDISRQMPSFLYVSSVPILLLILNCYDRLFFLNNQRASVGDKGSQADDSIYATSNDQIKEAASKDDMIITNISLPNHKTDMKQPDTDDFMTPRTAREPSRADAPTTQEPITDFSLELLVTEMFLFLIVFLQRLTNYHTAFFRYLTAEQAQNMLKIYSHVPLLFDEEALKKRATILTSESYRIQSMRYLSFLLSDTVTFSDNMFMLHNDDPVKDVTPPFLFASPLHKDTVNLQGNFNQRRLSTLLESSKSESSVVDSLFLFSEMIADVSMGKELRHTNDVKQSSKIGHNTISLFQHTSSYDPYSKFNKNATISALSSSQMFYPREIPHTTRNTIAQGASIGSCAEFNVPYVPRNPTKDHRGSTTSKSSYRNIKKPVSRSRTRQGFKLPAQASQATLTLSDDTDGASIYRALEESVDVQVSQYTAHKLTHSIVDSTEDQTEDDSTGDGKELSYSFSAHHRDKSAHIHRLTGNYTFTDSITKQQSFPLPPNSINHKKKPPSQDEIDAYLKQQIKANKLILLEPCDSKFGQQVSSTSPSNEDNVSYSRALHFKISDPLYSKLLKGHDSTCSVVASLLSTVVYESALYQLLSFTQHLIINPEKHIQLDVGTKASDLEQGLHHGSPAVHAELINTFSHFLAKDKRFSAYNEIALNALISYFPSVTSSLFVALESKKFSFDHGISMVINALLDKVDLTQSNLYNLAATIIVMLLKMEFDHHANTFILFSMINYSLVTIDLTAEKKRIIIKFFNYVLAGVDEICSNDEAWIGKECGDDDSGLYEMTPISGKVSFIYKHFYAIMNLFHARLLIVIESEYRIQERSKILSMGNTITDLDLYTELKLSQADCYVGQVDLRLFSLQSLFNFLKENGRHTEAACVSLLISGLISEYLIVRPEFGDKIVDYPDLPPVYSLAKIVIPELRKIMPDITVQNDLDIWLTYIAKAHHIMGKNETMYTSLDGGQFIKLLTALQNAASEFSIAKFYTHAKHAYRLLMILSERYYHTVSNKNEEFINFSPTTMIAAYIKALEIEEKDRRNLLSLCEYVHYYWVSITTENNGKQSSIEYIYCCPLSESIREFTERLKKFYDPPDSQTTKSKSKISVQKVDCYKQEHSAAILTEKERRIKQKILAQLLSYNINIDIDNKAEGPEDSSSFLEESYSNPHLMGVRTEPALHVAGNILSRSHDDHMPTAKGTTDKSKCTASYYSNIIYNYYPFVLASDEGFTEAEGPQKTFNSFVSRQIFHRRIQQQHDPNDSSIKLTGCRNVYYYTAHPFPHTNSRQRIIYFYEEYSSPIQEAIKIIEKAIYDTENLSNEQEVNKVFQNLTGIVTPSVNSGTMDIVRAFLKKRNEPGDDQKFNIQVVSFDDLVSSTTIPLAEKPTGNDLNDPTGNINDSVNNTMNDDTAAENQDNQITGGLENSGEADDSLQIFPQNSMLFDDQDRENTSSPMAGVATNQSMQKVQSNELMEINTIDDISCSPYSNTGTLLSKSIRKKAPSVVLGDSLLSKSKSTRKEDDGQEINSDETDSKDLFAPEERLATIRASLTLNLSHHQSLAAAPFSSAINSSCETSDLEDSGRLESVIIKASSSYFALCPGFIDLFLSISVYPKLIAKTDLPIKHYRNLQRNPSSNSKASRALRQGSYLTGDSTHHGSSHEFKPHKLLHTDRQHGIQLDVGAYNASPYGTCRESGYHGRFNIAEFTPNSDHEKASNELLPANTIEKITILRNELPMHCKKPNSLTSIEMELCRERLGKLIVKLMDLQADTFRLARKLMGSKSDYEKLYLLALDTFLKMLDELEEYVEFDKERIKETVSQELPLF